MYDFYHRPIPKVCPLRDAVEFLHSGKQKCELLMFDRTSAVQTTLQRVQKSKLPARAAFWGFVSLIKCLHLIIVTSQVSALVWCLNVGLTTLGSRAQSPRGWLEFCLVFPIYLLTTPVHEIPFVLQTEFS